MADTRITNFDILEVNDRGNEDLITSSKQLNFTHVDHLIASRIKFVEFQLPGNPFICEDISEYNIPRKLWSSRDTCRVDNVHELIDTIHNFDINQSIHINSATHGNRDGLNIFDLPNQIGLANAIFGIEDLSLIANRRNISIHFVTSLAGPLDPPNANHIINAWCYSNNRRHKTRKEYRIVQDPVHGMIKLHRLLWPFVYTPQFQRLRQIKQTGCLYRVFPGASHNRYEHCLGTYWVATLWLNHLKEVNPSEVDDRDILLVQIAALCHDLGHGPFSHTFETIAEDINPNSNWCHEEISCEILEDIHKNQVVKILHDDEVLFVKSLIRNTRISNDEWEEYPDNLKEKRMLKPYLWEIVEARSGLDADKMDYLLRDAYFCGTHGVRFDYKRIIQFSFISKEGQLSFYEREAVSINGLFISRLYSEIKVYGDIDGVSIDLMINDILKLVSEFLQLDVIINKKGEIWKKKFYLLTDSILEEIQRNEQLPDAASKLINRINIRDYYPLIGQAKIVNVNKDNRTRLLKEFKLRFSENFYRVVFLEFGYGLYEETDCPLSRIFFGNPREGSNQYDGPILSQLLVPKERVEYIIRVYCTLSRDSPIVYDLPHKFNEFVQQKNGELIIESHYEFE